MNLSKKTFFVCLIFIGFLHSPFLWGQQDVMLNTETLIVRQVSTNTYVHVTYFNSEEYGKVACNGMIYKNKDEAVIFDTPTTNEVSAELIDWVQKELKCKVIGVVINHFHEDCLGGLDAFHEKNIPSYANRYTLELAEKQHHTLPRNSFSDSLKIPVGNSEVINLFPGAAHTRDNIVSYIPSEKVLFGGCMVKTMNASKGNVADAAQEAWPETMRTIKHKFPEINLVIPGHGAVGGMELLDYTEKLFSSDKN